MLACRKAILNLYDGNTLDENCGNAGLILARYLKEGKEKDGDKSGNDARDALFDAAVKAIKILQKSDQNLYRLVFERREKLGGTAGTFKIANNRMIIGLGGSSPLETGLTLNSTYGVPFIPGSALKGLAAHYCAEVWGAKYPNFKGAKMKENGNVESVGEAYDFMFGSTEDAGFLTFHDAWPLPSSLSDLLAYDVMTPHYGKYYSSEGKVAAPTDYEDPNPVTFLSVKGDFEIRVSCECEGNQEKEGKNWERLAMKLLTQALEDWGIGGKTNGGYGRGTLTYSDYAENEINSSARLFSPGQQVEIVYGGKNKKGNHQFKVPNNPTVRWEGSDINAAKGAVIHAVVKSYNPAANPQLILTD